MTKRAGLKPLEEEYILMGMAAYGLTHYQMLADFLSNPEEIRFKYNCHLGVDNYEPDISYVESATKKVIPLLKEGDLFIIESTSPIGTTQKMKNLIFSERKELEGKINIAYCPERVLPGNIMYELINNDRVIGGINEDSTNAAILFYKNFVKGKLYPTNAKLLKCVSLLKIHQEMHK